MKSNGSENSQERIVKATESLWKILWFSLYIIVFPALVAIIFFFIFNFLIKDIIIALGLSSVTFLFALLLFYRPFDKYRKKSVFLNRTNNPRSRIHITFIITIISLVVTPLINFIPENLRVNEFELLPLIGFAVLYNIVYVYYYHQPIDYFNTTEMEFKHFNKSEQVLKQPHNMILLINYIIHIIFLLASFNTKLSWLFALATNIFFYSVALISTNSYSKKIEEEIIKNENILQNLVIYKRNFVRTILTLDFVLLIQLPFDIVGTFTMLGIASFNFYDIMNATFLSLIFLIVNLKLALYTTTYYENQLKRLGTEKIQENKYFKQNFLLSIFFIILILSFSFIHQIPLINLLILPIVYIITLGEEKKGFLTRNLSRHVHLLNSFVILATVSFILIPQTFMNLQGAYNILFIIFFISSYFLLQIFVSLKYYKEKNILITQNILAVVSFYFIIYSLYPNLTLDFISFTTEPFILFISNILLPGLIGIMFSLYLLYLRHFYKKSWKTLRIWFLSIFLTIVMLIFSLVNIRSYQLSYDLFYQNLALSAIMIPVVYIIFSLFNYFIHLFTRESCINNIYNSSWVLIFTIFASLLTHSLGDVPAILLDFVLLSILIHLVLTVGKKIGKLTEKTYTILFSINGFLIITETFFMSSQYFILNVGLERIIAYFFSTCIVCLIINIGGSSKNPFIKKVKTAITSFSMAYGWFVLEWLYIIFNYQGIFLLFLYGLIIITAITTIIPLGYLAHKKILKQNIFIKYCFIALNVIVVTLFSFTTNFLLLFYLDYLILGISSSIIFLIGCYIGIFKIGVKIGYFKDSFYQRFLKNIYYPLGIALFIIFNDLSLRYLPPPFNQLSFSILTSMFLMSVLTNIANLLVKSVDSINTKITSITIFYGEALIWFYTIGNMSNLFIIPSYFQLDFISLYISLIFILITSYIPFYYISKKNIINQEKFNKFAYFSLYFLNLLIFLLISSEFYYYLFDFYILALIGDIIYITIAVYYLIKHGFKKKYIKPIHVSKRTAITLYSILFIELYAFIVTIFILFTFLDFLISCYLSFVIIGILILLLSNQNIIFSITFSKMINLMSLVFTSGITSYLSYEYLTKGTTFQWIIPPLVFSVIFLIAIYYALKNKIYIDIAKKLLVINGIILSLLIISLPTFVGYELIRLGTTIDIFYVFTSTIILIYIFLKYLEYVFDIITLKERNKLLLKFIQLTVWISISLLISFKIFLTFNPSQINQFFYIILCCSFLTFLTLNLNALYIIDDIKQRVFENQELKIDFYKIYKIYEFYKNFSFFAIILSISGLITSLFYPLLRLIVNPVSSITFFPVIIQSGVFLLVFLLLIMGTQSMEIEYEKTRIILLLSSWSVVKVITCFLFYLYLSLLSFFIALSTSILVFSFLSPITMSLIRTVTIIHNKPNKFINSIMIVLFYGALLSLYVPLFWNLLSLMPFFVINEPILIALLICNLFFYLNYIAMRLGEIRSFSNRNNLLNLYLKSILALVPFFYYNSPLGMVFWLIAVIILLSRRNKNLIVKWATYLLFTFTGLVYIIAILQPTSIFFVAIQDSVFLLIADSILVLILLISINLNLKMMNNIEKYAVYFLLSTLSYISLLNFLPPLYNISISLLIFLVLMGNFYYRKKDPRYKLFIRPCVVLAVFNITSFIFYGFMFNNPPFSIYQSILSFTSTFSLTGFTFVSLYNESPQRFRKLSYFIVLPAIIIAIPLFIYFFTISIYPAIELWIPLVLSINVGIFLFYLSIGIYQWKISWAIWKTGFWLWILLPIVNYTLIARAFTGVDDVATKALDLFGFNIPGSYLLAFVVCILLSFPFWYTWIKKNFSSILFGTWAINLALLYWFSQNMFSWNEFLLNSSFGLFAIFLLMPIIYKLKFWKILMVFWSLFTFVSISFINFAFIEIGLNDSIIPVDITVAGISCFFLSYFPNMRTKRNVFLLAAYLILTTGISLIVFDLMYLITGGNPWTSLELTLIITSSSLFSSRLFKMNKIVVNFLISWTLLLSFSFLTYHTFILIEGFEWNAIFLALIVGGLTFFIFNRYKMLWGPYERLMPISSLFAYLAISLGVSLTVSSLILLMLPEGAWFLIVGLFLLINLIFLNFKLHNYKFLIWYMMPIAVTLLLLQGLISFSSISTPISLILSGILLYTLICQLVPISKSIKPVFALILYFDATILSTNLLIELGLTDMFLITIISLSILFGLTFLDLYIFRRKIKKWYISLINLLSYLGASTTLFLYALQSISGANTILIWLYMFIFLLFQNYSVHVFFSILKLMNKYEIEKLDLYKSNSYLVLSNALYLLVCLYGALQINSNLTQIYAFQEFTSIFLFLTLFSLFFFILNSIFNQKMRTKSKYKLKLSIFIVFQSSLLVFWILALLDLQFLILIPNSITIFWFSIIALIETILTTYPLNMMKKNSVDESSKNKIQKFYTAIQFCIYLELSILAYGFFTLYLDIFLSLLLSQILLFFISLIEIYGIKRLRELLGYIMHIFSILMISGSYIFYVLTTQVDLHIIELFILPIILVQFYTNYAYYKMRRKNNPEKANDFELGAIKRQKIIGNAFYLGLIVCFTQYLIFLEVQIIQIAIIISVAVHILVLVDRVLLIFLGRLSKSFLVISLASINVVTFILLVDLILSSTILIIPILIFIIEMELFYLTKLTETKRAVKNVLIAVLYINFSSWPLYFITTNIILDLNLIILAFIILLIFLGIDKSVGALNETVSKRLKSISLLILGLSIPTDTFLLLNNAYPEMLIFNAWTTLLVATLELGIILKPYKKKRTISFFYTLAVFLEIFSTLFLIDLTSLGISIFVIGILVYLFVFLMEELKAFFNNIVDYMRKVVQSLRTFINKILHGIYNFLKRSYVVIKIIFCAGLGILIGYIFSVYPIVLATPLNTLHSSLLGAAVFGVLLGLLPTRRTDDVDRIFRTRMTRFGTVWISMTAFIFVFIIPYMDSFLLGVIIILSSLLALGAIVAIYIYRIEKKQKISIKWRFYITTALIITVIIWGILIAVLYFTEVNV